MKAVGKKGTEWGSYQDPTPGWHEAQVCEGIRLLTKDNGKTSMIVPLEIISGSCKGIGINFFAPGGTQFGEQKMADLVDACGYTEKCTKKFDPDASFFDAEVVDWLSTVLPDKRIAIKVDTRSYQGKDRAEITCIDSKIPEGKGASGADKPKVVNGGKSEAADEF